MALVPLHVIIGSRANRRAGTVTNSTRPLVACLARYRLRRVLQVAQRAQQRSAGRVAALQRIAQRRITPAVAPGRAHVASGPQGRRLRWRHPCTLVAEKLHTRRSGAMIGTASLEQRRPGHLSGRQHA